MTLNKLRKTKMKKLIKQINFRQIIVTFVPSVCVLFAIFLVGLVFNTEISYMTRDTSAIANIHPLAGVLSNLGILLWCCTAAISFFSAIIIRKFQPHHIFWFFIYSSCLSAYMLLDDLFLFHETLGPEYLGLDEKYIILALGISVFTYLILFRKVILQTNFWLLFLAVVFFIISVLFDKISLLQQIPDNFQHLLEDGNKWLGIASWCSYYTHTSYDFITKIVSLDLHKSSNSTVNY